MEYVKSKYKNVAGMKVGSKIYWYVNKHGISHITFETEKDAAIAVDKILIRRGKDPVNILIKKP